MALADHERILHGLLLQWDAPDRSGNGKDCPKVGHQVANGCGGSCRAKLFDELQHAVALDFIAVHRRDVIVSRRTQHLCLGAANFLDAFGDVAVNGVLGVPPLLLTADRSAQMR